MFEVISSDGQDIIGEIVSCFDSVGPYGSSMCDLNCPGKSAVAEASRKKELTKSPLHLYWSKQVNKPELFTSLYSS